LRASRYVAKNALLMTIGLFAGRLLAFLVFRRMTGEVGTDGTGVYGVSIDLTSIILTFANFGLGVLITREVVKARHHTWPLLWAALRIRWVFGLAAYGLLMVYVFLSGYDSPTILAILIMALGVIVEATAMACDSVLQAHEKVQHQTTSQILSAVVYFVLGWVLMDQGYGVMGVIWANLISRVARLAVIAPLMFRSCGPWQAAGPEAQVSLRWMIRLGLPVFAATTFGIISYKIDTVMIMEMIGKVGTGIYTIGHRPLDLLLMVPNIFATALFPALQRYQEQDRTGGGLDVVRMGERSLRYLHLVIFPLTLFCTLAADPLIRLIAKSGDLEPSIGVFRIVIWGLPFQSANLVYMRLLMAANREGVFLRIAIASMSTNVLLNLLLIPRYEWYGAAFTTVVSLGVSYLLHRRYLHQAAVYVPTARGLVRGGLAGLLAWGLAAFLGRAFAPGWGVEWWSLPVDGFVPLAVMTALTGVLYVAAALLLGAVSFSELRFFRDLLPGGPADD
jgi:O-antigen/teichoic acid export membrane protein